MHTARYRTHGVGGRGLCGAVALMLALAACGEPLPAEAIAERYWRALMTREAAKVRPYVRRADQAQLQNDVEILALTEFELGRIVIDGDHANIDTRIVLAGPAPLTVYVITSLVREADFWRVDYSTTVANISVHSELARTLAQVARLADQVKQGLDSSLEQFKQALPALQSELSRIESDVKQQMPELRQRLEEFSKKIRESLQLPPRPGPPARVKAI